MKVSSTPGLVEQLILSSWDLIDVRIPLWRSELIIITWPLCPDLTLLKETETKSTCFSFGCRSLLSKESVPSPVITGLALPQCHGIIPV